MKNDTQFEAYKPIFKIQTVCSSLIGQRSKNLAKKVFFYNQTNNIRSTN